MSMKRFLQASPFYLLALAALIVIFLLSDDLSRKLYWDSDYAIYLADMFDASRFKQTLGIASRFGWSHPGPLNYYVLWPVFWFSHGGDQSLVFGTAVLNFAMLFLSAKLIEKMIGRALSILFLVTLAWYFVTALGVRVIFDVLLPFSTIFPWVLAVCLACAVVLRGWRFTIILAPVLAYVTQAHVAFWVPSTILAISSVIFSMFFRRPDKKEMACLSFAGLAFFLLWIPPLLEFKNLQTIFHFFFVQPPSQHSLADAARALAVMMGEPLVGKSLQYANVPTEHTASLFGAATLALIPILTCLGYVQKKKFALALGLLVLLQASSYLFSLTKVVGPILHHSVTFFPVLTPFIVLQLASVIFDNATERKALILIFVNLTATVALLSFYSKNMLAALDGVKTPNETVRALSEKLGSDLQQCSQPPVIKINQESWNFGIAATSYVYRTGAKFAISPHDWATVFGGRVPVTTSDCQLTFTWQDKKANIAVTDYGDKSKYEIAQRVSFHDLVFSNFGKAKFGKNSVRSAVFTDASLVSNEFTLAPGLYKGEAIVDYDITAQAAATNGAHISIHGKSLLLPVFTGRETARHVIFYFELDGQPIHFSFGLGGWSTGKGFIELQQLNISSIKKIQPVVDGSRTFPPELRQHFSN